MATGDRHDGLPYTARGDWLCVQVKAIPNAGRSEIVGVRSGELVVKLQVPALEGRANRELVRLLARHLGVARSSVLLLAGQSSPHKRFQVPLDAAGTLRALCRPAD
ncbi:MAG: DUF167 domain-containing protein [Spirochaetales bacterium]|nr:DUF167 domain-containing protein [Spirochaetales bacterium]